MAFVFIISALVAIGQCSNGSPVEVTLAAMGGSLVEVQITNIGGSDLNLFQRATILDPNPNRKVDISTSGGKCGYPLHNAAHLERRKTAFHRRPSARSTRKSLARVIPIAQKGPIHQAHLRRR
jgi:hypothetical protein